MKDMRRSVARLMVSCAGILFLAVASDVSAITMYRLISPTGTQIGVYESEADCRDRVPSGGNGPSGMAGYQCVAFDDGRISCTANGGACTMTCTTANIIYRSQTDCGWLQQCCAPTSAGSSGGACTGNNQLQGTCQRTCPVNTVGSGVCTTANHGAAYNGFSCCTAVSGQTTNTPASTNNPSGATPAGQAATSNGSCTNASGVAGFCYTVCPSGYSGTGRGSCSASGDICCTASGTPSSGTAATAGSISSVTFTNPLQFDTVQGATATFLDAFQGIIVMLALIFIVLGGIMYITSAGDDKKIGTAKKMITAAMIGLAIGVAAPSFLKEIGNILGWGGAQVPDAVNNARSATEVAQAILDFLLSIVGLLAMIMLVIGGLMYFAAAGDEKRADTAKNIVKYSIMGLSVAIVSLIIVRTIAGLL